MLGFVNILLGGIAYGFVLFLMAGGLSITLGLMGFANMAHAALAMVGGYTASLLIGKAGWPFLAAVLMAGATAALTGAILERTLFRRLYQASELEQGLLTIGVVVGKYLLPGIGAFIIYATALGLLTVRPQGLVGRPR